MTTIETDFYIHKEDVDKATEAIRKYAKENYRNVDGTEDIEILFRMASLEVEFRNGHIVDIWYTGEDDEPDYGTLKAIAPFVLDDSYITFLGDPYTKYDVWQLYFRDGKMYEFNGEITFNRIFDERSCW